MQNKYSKMVTWYFTNEKGRSVGWDLEKRYFRMEKLYLSGIVALIHSSESDNLY
jgi:hypothetical protein